MGLDRDDTIVRRRLRQKLEFFTDDLVGAVDPTEEQLEAYLSEHPDAFRVPAELSFRQIYFNRDRRGEQATSDAESLLERLNGAGSEVDTAGFGDSLRLPGDYERISEIRIRERIRRRAGRPSPRTLVGPGGVGLRAAPGPDSRATTGIVSGAGGGPGSGGTRMAERVAQGSGRGVLSRAPRTLRRQRRSPGRGRR